MCPGQISRGHEKLVDNLSAREDEGFLEKFCPLVFGQRVMGVQPALERAEFLFEFKDFLRVDDCRVDLQPIADDSCVGKQTPTVSFIVLRHLANLELVVGFAEVGGFFQDRDPRKPGLIDLKHKPLKEFVIAFDGESVLGVVVSYIKSVFGVEYAVVAVGGHAGIVI